MRTFRAAAERDISIGDGVQLWLLAGPQVSDEVLATLCDKPEEEYMEQEEYDVGEELHLEVPVAPLGIPWAGFRVVRAMALLPSH